MHRVQWQTLQSTNHGNAYCQANAMEWLAMGRGSILDPDNGKTYTCTIWLNETNKDKLNVRGYIGPFFRTQEWIRTDEIPIE